MKKGNFLKSGAAFLFGMLAALTAGCMTSFAAYDTASLSACTVEGGNSIVVTGTASAGTLAEGETADDGYYYLFELHPYETGIGSRTDYVAWSEKAISFRSRFRTAAILPIRGCIPVLWRL